MPKPQDELNLDQVCVPFQLPEKKNLEADSKVLVLQTQLLLALLWC